MSRLRRGRPLSGISIDERTARAFGAVGNGHRERDTFFEADENVVVGGGGRCSSARTDIHFERVGNENDRSATMRTSLVNITAEPGLGHPSEVWLGDFANLMVKNSDRSFH